MGKVLLVFLSLFILAGCNDSKRPAPYGLDWNITEEQITKTNYFEGNGGTPHSYNIKVETPDFENGTYSLFFSNNKLVEIQSIYYAMDDEVKTHRILNYYRIDFNAKYGNPIIDEQQKYTDCGTAFCPVNRKVYQYDDVILGVSLYENFVQERLVIISYYDKNYFLNKLKR
ncbi:hypothetical protein [Caviibacterium pharyngocola]|uniref:Lipoprotein n=1 Tax=Caviibacterium pharyngocola TaxID=28159 RepID=A0A2M8RY58_9PAST|nr:hypothetical protein [Caviibacterium pharyngocola]PJG83815.1 hypothetical protein CVP04_01620 [Caviibacterium pharyngocola]